MSERTVAAGNFDSTPSAANAPGKPVSPAQDAESPPYRASSNASENDNGRQIDLVDRHLRQSIRKKAHRTNFSISDTTLSASETTESFQILLEPEPHCAADGESPRQSQIATTISPLDPFTSQPCNTSRSTLLSFYFNGLCRLNSAFDSPTNPFRHIIAQWAVESPLIMNCVMSMSARALFPFHPTVLAHAVQHHSVAVGHLSDILADITGYGVSTQDKRSPTSARQSIHHVKQAIMASIMLGISSVSLYSSLSGVPSKV